MSELSWFTISLPRDMGPENVTAVLRPLASRRRLGFAYPLVVLESWSVGGRVSWWLGVDARLKTSVPPQMAAQLSRLGIQSVEASKRPTVKVAGELGMRGFLNPLRVEMAGAVSAGVVAALRDLGRNEVGVVQWVVGPVRRHEKRPKDFNLAESLGVRERRQPDTTEQRLWREKIEEATFACRGRVGGSAASLERATAIARRLGDTLQVANTAHGGLRVGVVSPLRVARLASPGVAPLLWSCLLNSAELACVLGWPLADNTSDDLSLIGGHINAAPSKLLLREDEAHARPSERVLGESLHPAQSGELVVVPEHTSRHHLHLIGPTGSGKSNLLASFVAADMAAGHSVFVLEPKGDLVQDVLSHVPVHRHDDIVVIEPDAVQPVGFNVLAGPRDQAERRADQMVALLHELHGANFGPRTADVALHALITAARLPDGTLADVPVLLTNPAFRRVALAQVSDPLVLGPWWAWFDSLSAAEAGQVVAPLLNKLRAFLARDALRRMLGQSAPLFDLGELFTSRKIVLVNLNKGLLGPEASSLLGSMLLTQLWAAIQRRTAVPASRRHTVMVVIDEVQDYLHLPGVDLGDALAQARGLGVSLTLAHQHLGQLNPAQRAAILANARSRVVFRPATDDAKALAASFGSELTGDDLLRLRAFEACAQLLVDSQAARPFSVHTRPLPPWTSDPDDLRRRSAVCYGIDGAAVDQALTDRWQSAAGKASGPVGTKRRNTP